MEQEVACLARALAASKPGGAKLSSRGSDYFGPMDDLNAVAACEGAAADAAAATCRIALQVETGGDDSVEAQLDSSAPSRITRPPSSSASGGGIISRWANSPSPLKRSASRGLQMATAKSFNLFDEAIAPVPPRAQATSPTSATSASAGRSPAGRAAAEDSEVPGAATTSGTTT